MCIHIGAPLECTMHSKSYPYVNKSRFMHIFDKRRKKKQKKIYRERENSIVIHKVRASVFAVRAERARYTTVSNKWLWIYSQKIYGVLWNNLDGDARNSTRDKVALVWSHSESSECRVDDKWARVLDVRRERERSKKSYIVNNASINTAFETWDDNSKLFHRLNIAIVIALLSVVLCFSPSYFSLHKQLVSSDTCPSRTD